MKGHKIRYSFSFFDKFTIVDKLCNSSDLVIKSKDTGELLLMKEIAIVPE
jgi:hypothetical protein